MPKDTKSSGCNKAPACESRGFGHKKEGENFDTPSCFELVYYDFRNSLWHVPDQLLFDHRKHHKKSSYLKR